MKRKLSISIEDKTFKELEGFLEEGTFRNKSHFIEVAIKKFIGSIQK